MPMDTNSKKSHRWLVSAIPAGDVPGALMGNGQAVTLTGGVIQHEDPASTGVSTELIGGTMAVASDMPEAKKQCFFPNEN